MIRIAKCPLCSQSRAAKIRISKVYRLSRCRSCQMIWDPSPPADLISQYQESYFRNDNPKGGYANYFEGVANNNKTFAYRLRRIAKRVRVKSNLLDVGAALGDFLLAARKLGWTKLSGVEVSTYGCQFAASRRLKLHQGTLKDIPSTKQFSVITSQDVIEHVTDPLVELKQIYQHLRPGGLLYLVTPDITSWWSKILGPYWYHYKPGEHVVYFSSQTIYQALTLTGFQNISVQPTQHFMSLEYIINRLRVYSPIFSWLHTIIRRTSLKNYQVKINTGELEAWAYKPLN